MSVERIAAELFAGPLDGKRVETVCFTQVMRVRDDATGLDCWYRKTNRRTRVERRVVFAHCAPPPYAQLNFIGHGRES